MVFGRQPHPRLPTLGGFGSGSPPPRDLLVLLGVVFVTFSLQFFAPALVDLLRLTPLVWQAGLLWQLVTYPVAGYGGPSLWFLLELLILFWFGRDVFLYLGRRGTWRMLAVGTLAGSLTVVVVELVGIVLFGAAPYTPVLLQGQRMLMVILIAAFATLYRHATIYLFFVLPVQAKWFLALEILIAFMGFLGSRDLAGFLGICAAVGAVALWLQGGGRRPTLREGWLRLQRFWLERRMKRARRRSGFKVVPGERPGGGGERFGGGDRGSGDRGPFIH
ncbi:MAG TPA: hypothetical protein VHQ65_00665 [Thermoanaerobaculia bacterium]|nr:hypothetical protein [Thermoanaerobaculia bacterium]